MKNSVRHHEVPKNKICVYWIDYSVLIFLGIAFIIANVIYIVPMFLEILVVPAYALWAAGQRFNYKYRRKT